MSENYVMPVKAIKSILQKELLHHKDGFYNSYPQFIMSDVQKEIVSAGFDVIIERLNYCDTHAKLDDFIGSVYRMSLEEWINSL